MPVVLSVPAGARGTALAVAHLALSLPLGVWLGRVPQVKESLGASDADWGLATSVATCGEVLGLELVIVLIGRVRTRTMALVAAGVALAASPLVALSPALPALVVSLLVWMLAAKVLGATAGALVLVHQRQLGRSVVGHFDALDSLGMLSGGALSWSAIRGGIPVAWQLAAVDAVIALALSVLRGRLPDEPRRTGSAERLVLRLRRRLSAPVVLLGVLSLLASIVDAAASQWAGIHLARSVHGSVALGALGYTVVMASKSVCLLVVGAVAERLGWRRLALLSVAVTVPALVVGVGSGRLVPGLLGLVVLGVGTAFLGPMVNTLAGEQRAVSAGEARSMLELGELPAYLLTPLAAGLLAAHLEVRWALLVLTCGPLLLGGLLLASPRAWRSIGGAGA
ncbi:hypothetical protein BRM3_12775 [Brachybacterium huguangmaarense]|uniref:MFS transporter n=1 Tax=Brachybacterium huguangmaarense TaxID=1652028 RepID=A0ABY6G1A9_9MICO|nr:hypothetical protein [Brachybacterium huguangmaarense]UYG16468.1 hypothetical protein BRM3_12775 [Brachybacterium huguangmaarense]